MHAQYNIMQAQHTIKHVFTKINPNMTYARTTCQHAYTIPSRDMHVQHAIMQAQYGCY